MIRYFERIKYPALRWGLFFGIILGIAETVYNFATSYITDTNAQLILGYIPAVLFLVLGFYAGLRAAQATGKWTSGLISGLWVGLIGAVIADLIPLAYTLLNLQSIVTASQTYIKTHEAAANNMKPSDYTASDVIITALVEMLVLAINSAFFACIGGGLGAFVGRRRAIAVSAATGEAHEEAMFEAPADPAIAKAEHAVEVEIEIKNQTSK